jgi:hypothetical protein
MRTGHRSAWRRRSRATRIAVPLAIPVALGLTIGIVIAVSGGSNTTSIKQSALGTSTSPSAAAGTGTGTVAPADTFSNGQVAFRQLGDVATAPVSGAAGATPISLNQTAAEAAASMNCTIQVPANPLTARGLATPWQLGDGCSMANAGTEGAFVEATILAPNGSLQVYSPLVVTAGTTPAVAPVAPRIARGSEVEISVGFNGTNLVLTGAGATEGNCVDALGQSLIGQVSACNAVNFYNAANRDIAEGTLKVPAAGTSDDGQQCETTRDFALVDQDPSDNVVTQYLINANGQTAQNNPANEAAIAGATTLFNGSDDALLSEFVDPSNGCAPFTAPDTTYPKADGPSQALNELSARVNQQAPIGLVPPNDEMVLVNGNFSIAKTNVYRSLVDQPLLSNNDNPATVAADFCQNMVNIAPARDALDATRNANFTTPVPATGDNLNTFMGNRLSMSFVNLGCNNYGLTDPVNVTLDGNQVATAVTFNTAQQLATVNGGTGAASPSASPTAAGGSPAPGSPAPGSPAPSASASASPSPTAPNPTASVPVGRHHHGQDPSGM